MNGFLKKVGSSVFVKLFLVIIVSGVLLTLIFIQGLGHALRPQFEPTMHLNVERYARYLIPDLGKAPHFEKGKELCKELGIDIRVDGEGWSWSSSEELAQLPEIPAHVLQHAPPPKLFLFGPPPRGKFGPSVVVDYQFENGPAKVMVVSSGRFVLEPNYYVIFGSVALLILVLTLAFLVLRWLLSPIHDLVTGVDELSKGNLSYQLPRTTSDELGRLSMAFNEMVVRIRQMVHSKQQLLVDVSHELRSPLTRAKVSLELIDADENAARAVDDLNELDDMIEELLESARLEKGAENLHREVLDLANLAREVTRQYVAMGKDVRLVLQKPEIRISVDMLRFKSVLRNLVENAIKYSPADKPITVSLSALPGFACLEVKDEGTGIPAIEAARVFEPFYRVDKSRNRRTGGFGLGLSLCKKIVEAHGGTISILNDETPGTRVQVLFPLS